VARARARLLLALDRRAEAGRAWQVILEDAHHDVDALRELAATAHARGDTTESLRLLARAASLRPELTGLTLDWAEALEGAGDAAGARAALEVAARRLPDEPALAAALGKLLDRMGETGAALEQLRGALALRPQDPELRRYADGLAARVRSDARAAAAGDLARRFSAAVPEIIAAEASAGRKAASPAPAGVEADPAVVLLDRRVVRVHRNGLAETFAQRVVEVRTDSGAEDNKEFYVRYTPGAEEVEILEARIFRRAPGGELVVLQASERDDQSLSEPWYGLYYDYRAEVVRFEGLRAGDVLEVSYLISDVSRENQLAGYFGDIEFIAEAIPKRRWEYTLLGPKGRSFHFARPRIAGLEATESDQAGGTPAGSGGAAAAAGGQGPGHGDVEERVYRFAARDIPKIDLEPAMPGIGEVSPYLHVSTYATWDEVGAWYWRLVEEQLVPDDALRRAAHAAVRPRPGQRMRELDKVRAIYDLVVGETRYVGLEFGIHGYKPYKVSQVLARKFGDCKDKAALMVALLGEVGIDAEMTLLRTRRGGRLAPAPASLAIFDHAIVYVPKLDLYLDGTAEFSGMEELPGQDQGVMVLRVGPRGSLLTHTPVLPSERNTAARTWEVKLATDGTAEVRERLVITGQAAPEWREHYQTPGERRERYAKVWTGRHPGARLVSLEMPGIEDRERPITVLATAEIPQLGVPAPDGGLSVPLGSREADFARTYARLSVRRSELVIAYPWRHQEHLVYHLPPGFTVSHLPGSRRIDSPFGSFRLDVEKQAAGTVVVDAALDVARERVPAADYGELRRFLAEIDVAMAERIALGRSPAAGSGKETARETAKETTKKTAEK
jgi:tetratricopeptide (TPR) repeat protein/transglutaminase-like putative cysteine protease